MSDAREVILRAVAGALSDVPGEEATFATPPGAASEQPDCDLLASRVADYHATVARLQDEGAISDAISATLGRHPAGLIVAPGDLPPAWSPPDVEILYDGAPPLGVATLEEVDGVITGCSLAIATTGTIILDSGRGQGRRILTLLPDLHVCVVLAGQVVQTVPEAIERLSSVRRPVTMISGPSATSDIELNRVEGVHGPRRLEVLLVG